MACPHQHFDPGWVSSEALIDSPALHPKRAAQPRSSAAERRDVLDREVIRQQVQEGFTIVIPSNRQMREDSDALFEKQCRRMSATRAYRQEHAAFPRDVGRFDKTDPRTQGPNRYESYRLAWTQAGGVAFRASRSVIAAVRRRSGSETGRDAGGWLGASQSIGKVPAR